MNGPVSASASSEQPFDTGSAFSLADLERDEPIELEFPPDESRVGDRPGRQRPDSFLPAFPALDGLKGVAVVAVLLFDAGLSWAKGGHLGVSTLFTLSGFLAVAGLLAERGDGNPIDLRGFWGRRVRRVLPVTLIALTVAGVFAIVAAADTVRRAFAADALTSLVSVSNWRFILDHQPFGPAFDLSSPARQFWALSLLGQMLVLVPIVLVLLVVVLRWPRARLGFVFGAGIVVSVAIGLALASSPTRVLYGTDTRAAEVLAGCLLAVVIYDPRVTIRLAVHGPVRDTINLLGALAGIGLLAAYALLPPAGRVTLHGGLALVAGLSALVVLAAIVPEGPVVRILASRPARWLGHIAIALYVVHWPIFVWLSRARTGLALVPNTALRFAAALAAAVVVQWAVDAVRARGDAAPTAGHRSVWFGVTATAAVVVLALAASLTTPDAARADLADAGPAATATSTSTVPVAAPPRVAFYGDASAATLEAAAMAYADETGKITVVPGGTSPNCGIDRDGLRRGPVGDEPIPETCRGWETAWAASIAVNDPDVVIVSTGASEVTDHKGVADTDWAGPSNPGYDYQLYLLMTKAVEVLGAGGAKVVWLGMPTAGAGAGAASDPLRVAAYDTVVAKLAASHPDVSVGDLPAWVAATGPTAAPGIGGFAPDIARSIVSSSLVPQILVLAGPATDPTTAPATDTSADPAATVPTVAVIPSTVGG